MLTSIKALRKEQIKKKRLLEREFEWIHHEFTDFHTLSDIELRNLADCVHLYTLLNFR